MVCLVSKTYLIGVRTVSQPDDTPKDASPRVGTLHAGVRAPRCVGIEDAPMRIGVDAGGTFTDFIVLDDDGRIETFKLRSNPAAPASVILAGVDRAAGRRRADLVHGSTVATNALLERKGARTALITTAGFEDVIQIGRQNRAELYNLTPAPRLPLVPKALRFGVNERAHYDGTIARRPAAHELKTLAARLKRARVESIGICFLHA